MFDTKFFDDIAKRLAECVPSSLKDVKQDLEKNFRSVLQDAFSKLDLITREEFDTQVEVLARTREKLEQLEKHVAELEKPHKPAKAKKETSSSKDKKE